MTQDPVLWQQHEAPIDLTDGHQVLDFAYEYLRKQRRAPTDTAVREITAILARCNAGLISYAVLHAVVEGALGAKR